MTRTRNGSGPSVSAVGSAIGGRAGGAAGRGSWRPSGACLGRQAKASGAARAYTNTEVSPRISRIQSPQVFVLRFSRLPSRYSQLGPRHPIADIETRWKGSVRTARIHANSFLPAPACRAAPTTAQPPQLTLTSPRQPIQREAHYSRASLGKC